RVFCGCACQREAAGQWNVEAIAQGAPVLKIDGEAVIVRPCQALSADLQRLHGNCQHQNSPTMAVAVVPVALTRRTRAGSTVPPGMPLKLTSSPDNITTARLPAPPT